MKAILLIILVAMGSVVSPSQGKPQVEKKLTPKQIFQTYNDSVVKVVTNDGSGSGFFVKNGLLVATCYHVIKGATSIEVQGTRGEKWQVGFVYLDKDSDAAILKLADDSGRKPIPFGDFTKLSTGDDLSIIGNPLGFLDQSLTTGIVSARRNDGNVDLIQTTAAISPGSSGSPVLNSMGQFVGFVSFHFTEGQALNMAVSSTSIVRLWSEDQIPIQTFLEIGRTTTKQISPTPKAKARSEISEEERKKMFNRSLADFIGRLVEEEIKWHSFYGRWCEIGSQDDKSVIDEIYFHGDQVKKALLHTEDLTNSLLGSWTTDDIEEFFKCLIDIEESVKVLTSRQADVVIAHVGARFEPEKLKDANEEQNRVNTQFSRLRGRLYDLMSKKALFSWSMFKEKLSPPVGGYMFVPRISGLLPDPTLSFGCYVGYSKKEAGIPAGSEILQIKKVGDQEFVPVKTWFDIQDRLRNWREKSDDFDIIVQFRSKSELVTTRMKVSWPKAKV